MKIAIGCDHAGYEMKKDMIDALQEKHQIKDYGTNSPDSVDYPDFVHPVAEAVEDNNADLGILLCGSGQGVAMTANKHQKIRAALCWNKEITKLSREHNNANILCLPSRYISNEEALEMIEIFLKTAFEEGRHQRRVEKMPVKS